VAAALPKVKFLISHLRSASLRLPNFHFHISIFRLSMLNALRYYWIISKGYRFRPWASPYIQWRMETFFGHEAANLDARKFFALMWRERARMERFLDWVATRRRAQQASTRDL
jgi:hypothetical protein